MNSKRQIIKFIVRSIGLAITGSGCGLLLAFFLKHILKLDISKPVLSLISFAATFIFVMVLFPRVFKLPFGKIGINEFAKKIGLYLSKKWFKHVLLGLILASLSLGGMLFGSMMSGKFKFDPSTLTLGQFLFSLTPGIFEEVCFRGIIMIVLLYLTKSFKKAFIIQIIIFGLAHFKGIDFVSIADIFAVTLIAAVLTYASFSTKSLLAGIVFHYCHDSFLFFVQVPDSVSVSLTANIYFYLFLAAGLLAGILVTYIFSRYFNIAGEFDFYKLDNSVVKTV